MAHRTDWGQVLQILIICVTVVVVSLIVTSCELPGPFVCEGEDLSTPEPNDPLCHCEVNGLLCGHDGFPPCSECPQ